MTRRARNAKGELLESAFQAEVVGLAEFYGWRVYHTHDSRRSQRGFPDLVLVRPPELIFAELKTASGRPTAEQREWLDELALVAAEFRAHLPDGPGARFDVYLWRPDDFDGVIHQRLALGRVRHEPLGAL